MPSAQRPRLVRVAAVAAAHGVRGALKLRCFTEDPRSVAAYGPLLDEAGRELLEVRVEGEVKGGVIVKATGVDDRDTAELLRGRELFVPRQRLPDAEPDEFYQDDLIGLEVRGSDGGRLGRVTAVHDFGAGEVLAFESDDGRESMLPFTERHVPVVDLEAGYIAIADIVGMEAA